MAADYIKEGNLEIASSLYHLIEKEVAPNSGITASQFWQSLAEIVRDLSPQNEDLLKKRDQLQRQIDEWHRTHSGTAHDAEAYQEFLRTIGYLSTDNESCRITTQNVDIEIAETAGPQLVAPLDNPRYLLNAANARWSSLYDALYSTDAIPESEGCKRSKKYNPIRGDKIIAFARHFLDRNFPLEKGTHSQAIRYYIKDDQLMVEMGDRSRSPLLREEGFVAYTGKEDNPDSILLCKHGLHIEICFGEGFFIGRRDHANIYDILIEAAITTIMDCEDSVASVDAEDKVNVYRNWLKLMQGTLSNTIENDGNSVKRLLADDRSYQKADGEYRLSGRSLMLIRHVGAHLKTEAVRLDGHPIPETMLDAMVTTLSTKHDLLANSIRRNSRCGSIYAVKPKMHGPEEVALANTLFDRVEDALELERNTLKMGIMDEERRTSVNLRACIRAASKRLVFINTGFLDRTGDDIHTNMEAGAVLPKAEMKTARWLTAYENSNIDQGLRCGLVGRAQIGKGMWPIPDQMMNMLETKIQHLKAGANTAWVSSRVAATLHALHYHRFNVKTRQQELFKRQQTPIADILAIPIMAKDRQLSPQQIQQELENNIQSILGYVSRWIGQGIGCSKVPDINNIGLMEDCATLRISSQHIANWLHHGLLSEQQLRKTMEKMAHFVDRQNENTPSYKTMSTDLTSSIPFQCALDLIIKGRHQPNGYTEFILYQRRKEQKSSIDNQH